MKKCLSEQHVSTFALPPYFAPTENGQSRFIPMIDKKGDTINGTIIAPGENIHFDINGSTLILEPGDIIRRNDNGEYSLILSRTKGAEYLPAKMIDGNAVPMNGQELLDFMTGLSVFEICSAMKGHVISLDTDEDSLVDEPSNPMTERTLYVFMKEWSISRNFDMSTAPPEETAILNIAVNAGYEPEEAKLISQVASALFATQEGSKNHPYLSRERLALSLKETFSDNESTIDNALVIESAYRDTLSYSEVKQSKPTGPGLTL